jgi:hypothetical protein
LHLTYFKMWWRHWYPSMWLFISLMCSPSSWATEDVLSYTISFLIFFHFAGTRNTSSNPFCLQIISVSRWEEEY